MSIRRFTPQAPPNTLPGRPAPSTALTYRRDIDGLRAVAVLLVVLDHLHTRVRGGYVGVDVFFVISGYLIGASILKEMDAGTFSVAAFYERRIRRIFPALLVMMLFVVLLALRFFVPAEIESVAFSLISALLSVSNFLFWHQAGYFDTPSLLKPLLHTWSLAVEEQFYIVFPLLLFGIRRSLPLRLKLCILTLAGLSFALACGMVPLHPTAAFFLAPTRAWELLCGTALSQGWFPAIRRSLSKNLAGGAGLLFILVPAFVYSAQTPFPGFAALAPCLGAVLFIAAGEDRPSLPSAVLSCRPFAWVGLISYSLYLWHWPLAVFQNNSYLLIDAPPGSKQVKLAIFVASMVAAALSWRLVEQPFRRGPLRPGRRRLLLISAGASACLLLAFCLVASRGLSSRFPAEALAVDRYTNFNVQQPYRENVCFLGPGSTMADFDKKLCLAESSVPAETRPELLLLGDSHAAQLYPGLRLVYSNRQILQANTASCRPFLSQVQEPGRCGDLYRFIYGTYLAHHRPSAVLLAGRWDESELRPLSETVRWLQKNGQNVVLFGPSIEFDVPLPRLIALSLRDHDPLRIEKHRATDPQKTDRKLAALARDAWHVPYISMYENLCGDQVEMAARAQPETSAGCPIYAAPHVPLLFDTDHLTPEGSVLLARTIQSNGQLP